MSDKSEKHFEIACQEIQVNQMNILLYMQCLEESNDNKNIALSLYVERRVEMLNTLEKAEKEALRHKLNELKKTMKDLKLY